MRFRKRHYLIQYFLCLSFLHKTYYKKTIEIEDIVSEGYIQVIAGTFADVYINNQFLGYVITRHSLNFVVLENNIQIFDIKTCIMH